MATSRNHAWLVGLSVAILAGPFVAACRKVDWSAAGSVRPHGRYVGVGIYGPAKQWTKMVLAQQPKDDAAAKTIDDQVIIVVADSETGELRACGDLTGYCIGMNPWKAPLLASQVAPIKLSAHVQPDRPDLTVAATVSATPRHHHHAKRRPYKPASNPHAPPATAATVS